MNIVQELMKYDAGQVTVPKKEYKMTLAKLGNKLFVFPLVSLTTEVAAEIQEGLMEYKFSRKKKEVEIKNTLFKGKIRTLTEGCPEVFKNSELQKHFSVHSPEELILKLLTPGEIDILDEEIKNISGFDKENEVEEVKN